MRNRLNKPIISLILTFCIFTGVLSLVCVSAITPVTGVKVGGKVYEDVCVGDTITYTVELCAEEKFYGIEAEIIYDSEKLSVVPKATKEILVNFKGGLQSLNMDKEGVVKFSASGTSKYNFTTEKTLITLDFVVKDTTYSEIKLTVRDIWIDGYGEQERWYYKEYEPVITEGISMKENFAVTNRPDPPSVTESTEQTETQTITTTEMEIPKEPSVSQKGIGVGGVVYYIADPGDRVLYTVDLKAEKLFDNLEATVTYNSEMLEVESLYRNGVPLADEYEQGRWMCPNLSNPAANTAVDGVVKIYDAAPDGNDFKESKILIEIGFVVKDVTYSEIELRIDEMSVKGEEDNYFFGGEAVLTEGIEIEEKLVLGKKPDVMPTQTQPETDATESSAAETTQETESVSSEFTDTTEPVETQKTESTQAGTFETQASETTQTDATETQTPPTQTETTEKTETTNSQPVESKPRIEYLIGDANSDEMINVKDATAIQKAAASLITLSDLQKLSADCDGNAQVNVRDATAVQKSVAGISTGLPIGEKREV